MCSLSSSRQIDIRRWQGILRSKLIAVRGHLKEEYKNRHAQSVTFCEAMCKRLERKNCSKKSEYGQVSIFPWSHYIKYVRYLAITRLYHSILIVISICILQVTINIAHAHTLPLFLSVFLSFIIIFIIIFFNFITFTFRCRWKHTTHIIIYNYIFFL